MAISASHQTIVPGFDLRQSMHGATDLMLRYREAIIACDSVPVLSGMPFLEFFSQFVLWEICLILAIPCALLDLLILPARLLFARRSFTVGHRVYQYLLLPLRSIWSGEISAFQIIRVRYLTRILLLFHAQGKMNTLHNAFNLRHLDLLGNASVTLTNLEEPARLQKTFELFEKITKYRYQIGSLVVFGPLLTLLSLLTKPLVHEGLTWLTKSLNIHEDMSSFAEANAPVARNIIVVSSLFLFYSIWLLISIWIDLRSVLKDVDAAACERRAFDAAGIPWRAELPLDLIGFVVMMLIYSLPFALPAFLAPEGEGRFIAFALFPAILLVLLTPGVVALFRRIQLSR
jgi:hypothetical protein